MSIKKVKRIRGFILVGIFAFTLFPSCVVRTKESLHFPFHIKTSKRDFMTFLTFFPLFQVEDEKLALQIQCNDLQSDLQSVRKELLQAEQQKLDLESEKVSLTERTKFLGIEKEKVEMELAQIIRERSDLSNQLTVLGRKRDAMNDELLRTRQRLEQASDTNARVNRNLEELVKECEEKQV